MENETDLDEYLMNEVGKIFSGNHKQIGVKPWNIGLVSCSFSAKLNVVVVVYFVVSV